jgi:hypothetical protein
LYGPSGSGKSSLVKAGLLPRLAERIVTVYVESSDRGTEERLLQGLHHHIPSLGSELNLVDALAALRGARRLPEGRKVFIVLDQFEQWLHGNRDGLDCELVRALRQCDGENLQCMALVRDDFWLAASRFMQALEVPFVEGRNGALVDLFDMAHARKVLALFGRAHGRLESSDLVRSNDHEAERFLDQAVAELAEDGKVVPVRLALFAEIVKARPWVPATLKAIGGMAGVGATFLEETFSAVSAQPRHRRHLQAVRDVFRLLLPNAAAPIRGQRRSEAELLHASGYQARPSEFDDLLRMLDGELRLITPVDEENVGRRTNNEPEQVAWARTTEGRTPRNFQLSHDYLVSSLREWLTRKQRETWRGRAELRLAERTATWSIKPESRRLPASWEWIDIECFTRRSTRSPSERRLLQAARRHYAVRAGAAAVVVGLVVWGSREAYIRFDARALVRQLLVANIDDVPSTVAEMTGYRRQAEPLLRWAVADASLDDRIRLHARLALLPWDDAQLLPLRQRLLEAEPRELAVIRDSLEPYASQII